MFKAHGDFKLELRGNILLSHSYGAWNKETALEYVKEATALLAPVINQPWAIITHISDWELATPDCDLIHKVIIGNAVKLGLSREAVVNSKGQIKLEQFNLSLPDDNNFQRRIFEDEPAALQWLNQQGYAF